MAAWPRFYYYCKACEVRGIGARCWYCRRKKTIVPWGPTWGAVQQESAA